MRKGGSSEIDVSISAAMRRSDSEPISATAMAIMSAAKATGSAWKFPPDSTAPSSANTSGLSDTALASMVSVRAALASRSRHAPITCGWQRKELRLGTLVSPVTFRDPAVLARAALTVDLISGGRVEIGMGAGWWEEEHTRFGLPFHDVDRRWGMLEEQVPIVHGLFTEDRYSFHGKHYQLEDADQLPRPVQRPRPPLILGGSTVGPRMQALIGAYADEFNTVGGTPGAVADRFARARMAAEAAGRDQASLVTSLMTPRPTYGHVGLGVDVGAHLDRRDAVNRGAFQAHIEQRMAAKLQWKFHRHVGDGHAVCAVEPVERSEDLVPENR